MPTFYALPALSTWENSGGAGWSYTSGGASNGIYPTSGDPVVFDTNSGSSRSITMGAGVTCASLTTVGANSMSFTTDEIGVYGNIDLTGTSAILDLVCRGTSSTVKTAGATVTSIEFHGSNTLLSDLSIATPFTINGSATVSMNGFNVTAANINMGPGSTLNMGSGVLTLTAANTVVSVWGDAIVNPSTSILRLTNASATAKTFIGAGRTFGATEFLTGGVITLTGGNTFGALTLAPGVSMVLPSSSTTTVSNLVANGSTATITIESSTPGSAATLAKSGGGTVYVDHCSVKDIIASPGSTFFARNSTSVSGNSGWTFVPGNRAFLTFF